MAEPTLKDILAAIAKLQKGQDEVIHRLEGVDHRLDSVESDLNAFRGEALRRFDAIDNALGAFQGVLVSTREDARDVRADVDAIHKGLVRAIPKELPSQVRAKSGKRPATRRTRRA